MATLASQPLFQFQSTQVKVGPMFTYLLYFLLFKVIKVICHDLMNCDIYSSASETGTPQQDAIASYSSLKETAIYTKLWFKIVL